MKGFFTSLSGDYQKHLVVKCHEDLALAGWFMPVKELRGS